MSDATPAGWSLGSFDSMCVLQRGFDLPVQERILGAFPIIGSNGTVGYHNEFRVNFPGVVTGRSGSIGEVFFLRQNFWPLNTSLYIKDFKGNVEKFIYYFLQDFELRRFATGTGVPTLNRNDVHIESVLQPSYLEQQKIAAILTAVDEVIESAQAQINKLKDLKTGMMQELLAKGIGHTEFKDSSIGQIPARWSVKPLSDLSEKISDGLHATPEYVFFSKYFFINGNNLKNSQIEISNGAKYVSEEEYLKHRKDLGENSILMSINGTIGSLAYYKGEKVVLGKSCAYVNLKKDINKKFIFSSLNSDRIKSYFEFELTGTTIRNLSLRSIKNTLIAIPQKIEQEKISTILEEFDKNIDIKNSRLNQVKKIKKALMQDLLTGKVRVKVSTE